MIWLDAFKTWAAIMLSGRAQNTPSGKKTGSASPLIFAHRGASALLPEHTLEAYARAITDGADFIEPDLVMTKDRVLVARHENEIGHTTNVASHLEFSDRRTTKRINGKSVTGWFTEDFTLKELKTLRAIERLGAIREESQQHDGLYAVPTLAEIIELAAAAERASGKQVGIIPELKYSTYFSSIGLPLETIFLSELAAHQYTRRCPVIIQSFETANLRAIRKQIGQSKNVRLLQLIDNYKRHPADNPSLTYGEMATPAGLETIATYADAIGPHSRMLIPLDSEGKLGAPTSFVEEAHRAGLKVYPYTYRPENRYLPADLRGSGGENTRHEEGSIAEIRHYLAMGIDAFFADDPAVARRAVDGYVREG